MTVNFLFWQLFFMAQAVGVQTTDQGHEFQLIRTAHIFGHCFSKKCKNCSPNPKSEIPKGFEFPLSKNLVFTKTLTVLPLQILTTNK